MVNQVEENSRGHESNKTEKLEERKSEATSGEMVNDLQETEESSGLISTNPDPGPSPDGALDESDEIKDAGPM